MKRTQDHTMKTTLKHLFIAAALLCGVASSLQAEIPKGVIVNGKPKTSVISDTQFMTRFGWAVSVRNGTNQNLNQKMFVKVRFMDKQGVMLHEAKKEIGPINAFQSVNVTDTSYVEPGVWGRIVRIEAVIEENYF